MSVVASELVDSRELTTSASSSATLRYVVTGTESETEAHAALAAASPVIYFPWGPGALGLPRRSIHQTYDGEGIWHAEIEYGGGNQVNQTIELARYFQFDIGSGTQRVSQSLETVTMIPAVSAPDFKGAIGVTDGNVEGVDIPVPVVRASVKTRMPWSNWTQEYIGILVSLVGHVNDETFAGFAPGEVRFESFSTSGALGGDDLDVEYVFAISRNVQGQQIGELGEIDKDGWDYLWVLHKPEQDRRAKCVVQIPKAAYVERVSVRDNFFRLGIGT